MAVVFLLGPGMWAEGAASSEPAPIAVRRQLAGILQETGHSVLLMEEEPDLDDEDMVQKFERLLRRDVTDVLLYWPPLAKMQTTYDELLLLYDRRELLKQLGITIWALHHVAVAVISEGEFRILETGNRSRYLAAVARLGIRPLVWETDDDLEETVRLLAAELDA